MQHPRPDRSNYSPNFKKTQENDAVDIGWCEGVMSQSRPYRAECWAQDQVTYLSIIFSAEGFESATKEEIADMIEIEGIVRFKDGKRRMGLRPLVDASGNQLLVATLVVGRDEESYIEDSLRLQPWQDGRP